LDAEKFREVPVNPATIRNILTLRYDPSQKPILAKLGPNNLGQNNAAPSLDAVEALIEKALQSKIDGRTENVSIALSGGVDSTLVLASLRRSFPKMKINAISIRFADSVDETASAAKIAEHFEADHHIVELENYLEELPKAVSIIKLPFWDIHWYYVVKKARTLSKFLASGDGGDEVFGGYTFRYKKFLDLTNDESTPLEKVKAYLQCHERDRVPDQEKIFGQKSQFTWDSIYDVLMSYFDNNLSRLDQVLLADYNGKLLYNFSLVNSSLHDHFGIASVAPLLSADLSAYVLPLSNKFKYDIKQNVGKLQLRQLLKKYKADSLITEEKLGFNVNTINLWRSHGYDLCANYLKDAHTVRGGWISSGWIDEHLNKEEPDIRYVNKFLGLLAFEIWYRMFVTKSIDENIKLQ